MDCEVGHSSVMPNVLFFGVTAIPVDSKIDSSGRFKSLHPFAQIDSRINPVQDALGHQIMWSCPDWCFKALVEERDWWQSADPMAKGMHLMGNVVPAASNVVKTSLFSPNSSSFSRRRIYCPPVVSSCTNKLTVYIFFSY